MTSSDELPESIARRMRQGDQDALAEAFSIYRQRLKQIVRFRLDYRLAGRFSDSDVLQETFIAAARRLPHFEKQDEMKPFLWLRLVAAQELVDLHRKHVGAEKRDVRREISLTGPPALTAHTSIALAAHLVGGLPTPSQVAVKAERIDRLESTLIEMDEIDREVIALRHFEELSNLETAEVLQIAPSAASKRYLRAMKRLSELMADFKAAEST